MPTPQVVKAEDWFRYPDNFGYDYILVAEGDSWFSTNGNGDNLLKALDLPRSALIVSFAYPGDEIRNMLKLGKRKLQVMLKAQDKGNIRGLLLSGGGNDLITDAAQYIRAAAPKANPANPWTYIDDDKLAKTLNGVIKGYRSLAALRGGALASLPIVTHTYDYLMPRPAPATFLGISKGPWLHPVLVSNHVPPGMRPVVVDTVFNALAEVILSMGVNFGPNSIAQLTVADTRGILDPANPKDPGSSNDWLNEIHPTGAGYKEMATQRLNSAIVKAFNL
jgi:hypothetical protein